MLCFSPPGYPLFPLLLVTLTLGLRRYLSILLLFTLTTFFHFLFCFGLCFLFSSSHRASLSSQGPPLILYGSSPLFSFSSRLHELFPFHLCLRHGHTTSFPRSVFSLMSGFLRILTLLLIASSANLLFIDCVSRLFGLPFSLVRGFPDASAHVFSWFVLDSPFPLLLPVGGFVRTWLFCLFLRVC